METFTDTVMCELLACSLETARLGKKGWKDVGAGPGSPEGAFVSWLTFKNNAKAVAEDVRRIRTHPLVPASIPIYGYIYDVRTGRLNEVADATALGRARRGRSGKSARGSA
jgi:carbonic anhydrase